MGNILSYSGITTKIRAMQANLLTEAEYRELSTLGSVTEFVLFLKKHPAYSALFSDIDENRIHRGQIERLLNLSLYTDFTKIYRFSNPEQRRFLKLYFSRYEVSILKTCMRLVLNNSTDFPNKDIVRDFFEHFSSINMEQLFTSHTIEEFVTSLKDTEYYRPLSALLNLSNPTLFDYETTLDLFHFTHIWKLSRKILKSRELNAITKYYGCQIDMLNILWIYRSKKYYQMTPADIYALIIPVYYKLKKSELISLTETSSLDEFTAVLQHTWYNKFHEDTLSTGEILEDLYAKILNKINSISARKYPYSAASLNTYLYRKEHELDRLTTVLECIRYGLDSQDTLHYIIK